MPKTWNDPSLKRQYEEILEYGKAHGMTDEMLSWPYLDNKCLKETKNHDELALRAFVLGQLFLIKKLDSGKNQINNPLFFR